MLGKKKKLLSCLVIFTLLLSANIAYADKYWGGSTSYTAGSNKARHASYMDVAGSVVWAGTIIMNDSNQSLP